MRLAVVGHCEWVDFARVDSLPAPGRIVHARQAWAEPGGGGAIAAVQLARLAGAVTLFTAVGADATGRRMVADLRDRRVRVEAALRRDPTRRAVAHIDATGERAITVLGARLEPSASDPLAWQLLAGCDAVFVTAGDAPAVRAARAARVLVATARALPLLREAAVELDAVVGSAADPDERHDDLVPAPALVVRTEGSGGGTFRLRGGPWQRYDAAPLPGPLVDTFGAGDSFAAALTYALAHGQAPADAVRLAAVCAAAVVSGRGPYAGQPTGADLGR